MSSSNLEEYDVPAGAGGRTLRLARREVSESRLPPLVLLHGSSFPASLCYTVPLGGVSFMELCARLGLDTWAIDFRGYGGSWKPEDDGAHVADTAQAADDLSQAVDFICSHTGAAAPDLFGWSWGAAVAGFHAARGGNARRIALCAAQWLRDTPSPMVTPEAMSRSYRHVNIAPLIEKLAARSSHEFLEPLATAVSGVAPLIVPTGSARDINDHWMSGRPSYDPAAIAVPTLVAVGEDDADTPLTMSEQIYRRLSGEGNELATIPDATHYCVFEPARERLVQVVHAFLARTEAEATAN
ncbi:MAG: alpha/beta fold hydrolase [Rhizobiaceae bacterium]|nr:alpha/beta fold hydrolase [Rhizobiaceae bacterium]